LNRFLIPLVAFGVLAVLLGIGIKRSPEKGLIASPLIGKPAPHFSLPSLTDAQKTVSTTDLQGKWYVLNVWGTWCVACRAEHTMLLEMQRSGVAPVVGLNWRDDDAQALDWLAQLGNPYALIAVDREGRTAIDYGVYAAPETFLIDPKGIVVEKQIGPMTPEAWERFVAHIRGTARNAS
jgi:cytochrome c biogenesis protein CcmG, thiol:disulfide interchange protein DsbE